MSNPNELARREADEHFVTAGIYDLAEEVYENENNHGFNDDERDLLDLIQTHPQLSHESKAYFLQRIQKLFIAEKIALIHSEVSEMLEAIRKPAKDQHCPEYNNLDIEWSDAIIRLLTFFQHTGIKIGALFAKKDYNRSRPHKHGKGF